MSTEGRKPRISPWHAVSIQCSEGACAAARGLSKRRWLSFEVPMFPLPNCDAAACECRYRHHADRRATQRRLQDRTGILTAAPAEERRKTRRGRRSTDY
jgi:hypothetical protein